MRSLSNRIDKLGDENKSLRTQLNKLSEKRKISSKNSSLSPSKDKDSKNKSNVRRNALGKKAGKKRDGQPGHKEHERRLLPLDEVDHIISCHGKEHCSCGRKTKLNEAFRRHQKFEFPIIKPEVTECQLHSAYCSHCDKTYLGQLPEGVSWSMLGVRATAITACLSGLYRMSKQNIVRFYTDIFNLSISTGMVCKTEKVVSKSLERPVEVLKQHIQSVESEVGVHADETGFKECGQKRWAWVGITAFVAVFIIRQRRSKQVAKELLGESFSGILCSDRYSAYNWIPSSQR